MIGFSSWCRFAALCLWAGGMFAGCQGPDEAPRTNRVVKGKIPGTQEAVSRPAAAYAGLAASVAEGPLPATDCAYRPAGKLDPFEPVFGADEPQRSGNATPALPPDEPRTPLETADPSRLKLTAVVLAPGGNLAMVEDATGKGYIVGRGTRIGNRRGRVTEILSDRLMIGEQVADETGGTTSEMRFPEPPGGRGR